MDNNASPVELIRQVLEDRKAAEIKVYNCSGLFDYTDFVIVATAVTDRHSGTLSQAVHDALKERGVRPLGLEGTEAGRWIIMDYGDFVVHIFLESVRQFYEFDRLFER